MGRKSLKEVRQKEIIQAFYEVAKSEGLENTSIAKVAKFLEINPSLILHYFETKAELLSGLIAFNLDKYYDIYKSGHQGINTLSDLVQLINDLFSRKWNELYDDGVFYSCYALIYRDEQVKKAYKQLHDQLRIWLLEALQEASAKRIIHDLETDIEDTAQIIFALIEGAYYYLGMVYEPEEYAKKVEIYRKQALSILNISAEAKTP